MSRRILLADDSVTIQKVIELTFMDDDYEVRAVGNGDEALAMLTALQVDFVIADVHMPGAGGYEVCRRAKELRPEVPVLLLVGTFEPFDESQARACGADAYLKKPFDSQELLSRVHDLLARSAPAPATSAGPPPTAAAAAPSQTAVEPPAAPQGTPDIPAPPSQPGAPAGGASAAETAAASPAAAPAVPAAAHAVEAAESWQEFELEAEPEFIPDPWNEHDVPPPPSPGASMPPRAAEPYGQHFALGDLDERETFATPAPATPATPAIHAGFAPAGAGDAAADPGTAAAASPGFDRSFTLGEPLDDSAFLLDEAEEGTPAPPAIVGTGDNRITQAEPVSPFRAAAEPTPPTAPAVPASPAAAVPAFAPAGNGQTQAAAERTQAPGGLDAPGGLGDQDVDRIARRVVELIGDRVVRDIAWEVIPDLAEVVIKDRLRELESQIE
jgi:CheY-like chemotaxis protein